METTLKWKKEDYGAHSLNYWFCKYKFEGKTLEEITELFSIMTHRQKDSLRGALRLANLRHQWLEKGWEDDARRQGVGRSVYKIAKLDYTREFVRQGGTIHPSLKQTLHRWWNEGHYEFYVHNESDSDSDAWSEV